MKVKNLRKEFLKDLFVSVIPIFLVIWVFTMYYDNTPAGLGYTLLLGTVLIFAYGILASAMRIKKYYK